MSVCLVCLSFNALFGNMLKFCLNYDVIACIINTTNQCSCCLIVYNNLTLSMWDVGWHCCLANFVCVAAACLKNAGFVVLVVVGNG